MLVRRLEQNLCPASTRRHAIDHRRRTGGNINLTTLTYGQIPKILRLLLRRRRIEDHNRSPASSRHPIHLTIGRSGHQHTPITGQPHRLHRQLLPLKDLRSFPLRCHLHHLRRPRSSSTQPQIPISRSIARHRPHIALARRIEQGGGRTRLQPPVAANRDPVGRALLHLVVASHAPQLRTLCVSQPRQQHAPHHQHRHQYSSHHADDESKAPFTSIDGGKRKRREPKPSPSIRSSSIRN